MNSVASAVIIVDNPKVIFYSSSLIELGEANIPHGILSYSL